MSYVAIHPQHNYSAPGAMPAYTAGAAAAYSTGAMQYSTTPAQAGAAAVYSTTAAPAVYPTAGGGSFTAAPAAAYGAQSPRPQAAYATTACGGPTGYATSPHTAPASAPVPYAAPAGTPSAFPAYTTAPTPYGGHTTATAYSAPQPATYGIVQESQFPTAASMIAYPTAAAAAQAAGPQPFSLHPQQQAAPAGLMQPPTLVVPVGPGAAYSGQGPLSPSQQADGPPASLAPATVVPPAEDGYHGPKRTNSKKGKQGKSGRKSPKKTCC